MRPATLDARPCSYPPPVLQAMLKWINYITVRHLRVAAQRENVLRGPVAHMIQRHGRDIIPAEVAASVPELMPEARDRHVYPPRRRRM